MGNLDSSVYFVRPLTWTMVGPIVSGSRQSGTPGRFRGRRFLSRSLTFTPALMEIFWELFNW